MGEGGTVRQQRYEEVAKLRESKIPYWMIANKLGISESYAKELISDPDGSKAKERKLSYGGSCQVCGGPTDGSNGRSVAPEMCDPCRQKQKHEDRYWTRDRVLEGMRRLARDVAPRRPIATDVLKTIPVGEDGYRIYPPFTTIRRELGSWANAMEAIGFDRPKRGVRTPEGQARMVAANKRPRGARL